MTQHTDLIDRLRSAAWAGPVPCPVCDEAADALEAKAKNAFEAMPHDIPQRMKDAICVETGWSGSLVSRAYIELRKAFTGEPYKANEDLDAALLEIERLRKDAERYAVVRRGQHWSVIDGIGDPLTGDRLDAGIDAVIAAKGHS